MIITRWALNTSAGTMELGQQRTARLELSRHQIRDNVNNATSPRQNHMVLWASQANDASIGRWSVFVAACFFCSFWVMVFSHFLPCSLDKIESSSITLIFFQPLHVALGILIDYKAFPRLHPAVFALLTFKFKVFRHGHRPGRGEVLGQ